MATKKKRKVWKVKGSSKAGMAVSEETALMYVGKPGHANAIYVDDTGIYISGPVSFLTDPGEIRKGGFWLEQMPYLDMLPSTVASPIPHLRFDPAGAGIGIAKMAEEIAWAMGFLV